MANLDTPSKRRVWILPIPDGAVGTQDRPHVGIGYSGIVISGAPTVTYPGWLWNKAGWF